MSKNKKIVKENQMKIVIFTGVKNRCMLHGRVFVMYVFTCELCVRLRLFMPILALNWRLQIDQVNSDRTDSGDDPLAPDLHSMIFLIAPQIIFASY